MKFGKKLSLLFTISLTTLCTTGCEFTDKIKSFFTGKTENNVVDVNVDDNTGGETSGGNTDSGNTGGNTGGGTTDGGNTGGGTTGGGTTDGGNTQTDFGGYYASINIDSADLLSDLRTLNLKKRTSTVGYSAMGTSASGMYKYTDYDPETVKYDSKGQPYGTAILSFYSGKSTTSWNREHVWPNSRGGGSKGNAGSPYCDADIYMPRPTIPAENSNRGNSSYVEGMCHSENGWDPVTAFEDNIGVYPGIRGECARIIFYCMTVNSKLRIVDDADSNNSSRVSIGKLTDMIKWSLENPVNDREKRRNDGGQYLQGNRNAFVDHPEYVCKIWGRTNDKTKQLCGIK